MQSGKGSFSPSGSSCPEQEVYIHLLSLALRLRDEAEQLLKASGLTATQFNVLRLLHGAGEALTCGEIADRLVNKDPDVTRLLDRMEKQGLVERFRHPDDRRVLLARLAPQGLALVTRLDEPIKELHRQQFAHLPAARLKLLGKLLNEATL